MCIRDSLDAEGRMELPPLPEEALADLVQALAEAGAGVVELHTRTKKMCIRDRVKPSYLMQPQPLSFMVWTAFAVSLSGMTGSSLQ